MAKFRVCGPRTVNGIEPGGTLEVGDDTSLNLGALLTAGHIEIAEESANLKSLTVPQLKKYASQHDIDVQSVTLKTDLIELLTRRAPAEQISEDDE